MSFIHAVALLGAAAPAAGGRTLEVTYPPSGKPGELAFGVTYTLWLPDTPKPLRGVIVHQHGCGKGACDGGKTAAYDLHWQALARKWDCALLGPSYHQEDGQNCRLWCDPRNGSRATFLRALAEFARTSGRPELEAVPWCLWGHSGGGFWASLMMTSDPDRVVAAWLRSGTAFATWEKGEVPRPEIPAATYGVPFLANPGAKENGDKRFRGAWDGTLAMVRAYRAKGAPAGFAPDPKTGHECGDSRYLAVPFFDACLAARLPATGTTLRPIDMTAAWLAELPAGKAVPAAEYAGDRAAAGWLPDGRFAKLWAEYVATGLTGDATPPPAPRAVKAAAKDCGVEVTWEADADFESGLRQFVVLRDGKEVGRVPAALPKKARPLFQGLSYHDTPEPKRPEMRYTDAGAKPGGGYRVRAVNGAGLESPPSE